MHENDIGDILVERAIYIHRSLGPGLLESVYEMILFRELTKKHLSVQRQVPVDFVFNEDNYKDAFRADLIIENKVILELKSVETVTRAHKKQLLTYLKLTGMKLGYLLNFGEALMKDGITRSINGNLKI